MFGYHYSISEALSRFGEGIDYNHLVTLLDRLIDQVGEDETHPLASMMDVIGVLIESYEDSYVPEVS